MNVFMRIEEAIYEVSMENMTHIAERTLNTYVNKTADC